MKITLLAMFKRKYEHFVDWHAHRLAPARPAQDCTAMSPGCFQFLLSLKPCMLRFERGSETSLPVRVYRVLSLKSLRS